MTTTSKPIVTEYCVRELVAYWHKTRTNRKLYVQVDTSYMLLGMLSRNPMYRHLVSDKTVGRCIAQLTAHQPSQKIVDMMGFRAFPQS
jgi:hypothetical protein